jgi:hypothetical protein
LVSLGLELRDLRSENKSLGYIARVGALVRMRFMENSVGMLFAKGQIPAGWHRRDQGTVSAGNIVAHGGDILADSMLCNETLCINGVASNGAARVQQLFPSLYCDEISPGDVKGLPEQVIVILNARASIKTLGGQRTALQSSVLRDIGIAMQMYGSMSREAFVSNPAALALVGRVKADMTTVMREVLAMQAQERGSGQNRGRVN